jgi:uncharacterized protein YeaO (DUF488 family)
MRHDNIPPTGSRKDDLAESVTVKVLSPDLELQQWMFVRHGPI